MHSFDEIDKKLINSIQSNFPISERPYKDIADNLGLEEDEVITRLSDLKEKGIIRRIGGNFSPEKLEFTSTLCAAKVPIEKIDMFAEAVNAYTGVTHNYVREHEYNVWFTIIAPSSEVIRKTLSEIEENTGVKGILNLPATNVFKIKAQFEV